MVLNTFETLGDRAPVPCDIGEAHGVAQAFMTQGLEVNLLPFRQPPLLDNEVRIRVTHAGLCHSDIFISECKWSPNVNFPLVPGHEIVGIVEKVGERVTQFTEGERVGFGTMRDCCDNCDLCYTGKDNLCLKKKLTYDPHFGGYATSFQARDKFFFKMPDNLPGEYAPMFCAGITTFAPLYRDVTPGMRVGIGGIGGLGHLGIKFAKAMGCEVVALSTSPAKEQEARELGAHHFVNIKNEEEVKNTARTLDYFLTTATQFNMTADSMMIKPGGKYCPVGLPPSDFDVGMRIGAFVFNKIDIVPSLTGSVSETLKMIEFSSLHNILPKTEVYAFADMQAGLNSLAHGHPHYPNFRAVSETGSYFNTFTPAN